MANTNSATSHPKAPAADCAPKPSATSRTKATAPRNINLDEDEENIVPERTRTDRSRSTKQAQIDEEALDKEMAAMLKKLNAYKKTKRQQEKKAAGASKTTAFDDDDEEYESEEHDPPAGQGFFAQSLTSLGTVTSSTQRTKRLRKYNDAPPFNDINNIFNAPANVVPRGRPSSPHSRWSPSPTPPRPVLCHHGSVRTDRSTVGRRRRSASALSTISRVHRPEKCGHSTDRSPSTGPPKKLLKCAWRNGEAPTGRPGARDYELEVSSLILKAIREFEARIVTQDPVPLPDKQTTWVTECWTNACAKLEEKYELPDCIIGLIRVRTSNARSPLKDAVRPRVEATFQFVKTNSPDSKQGQRNQRNYRKAMRDKAFVYKDRENLSGLYETKLISEVIQDVFFKNNRAIGVEFQSYFNPITLVTIAFVLTAIEFNIAEWKSGVYIQAAFDEKGINERFKSHLKGVREWRDGAPVVVDKICEKLYKRAIRNAGGCIIEETSQILKEAQRRARQELATRTGDTDSEEDGPGIDNEELEEPNEYEDEQHQDDADNEDGDHAGGRSGAEEEE
ncbi:hypothetical protein PILCRDRAFT_93972 [Piloderma croceum F 1598]|uniref:DUF6532 domain-containing protein n=1 Tax=Piloderma croceum (strain F 1598) TaxID=765440 RepID=A0A0C3ESZ2_PILCF|nr:hypothetical protein PILCRDRAFT_93972 [Piloderma croceum F 1598]